jgi:hypothetical protein
VAPRQGGRKGWGRGREVCRDREFPGTFPGISGHRLWPPVKRLQTSDWSAAQPAQIARNVLVTGVSRFSLPTPTKCDMFAEAGSRAPVDNGLCCQHDGRGLVRVCLRVLPCKAWSPRCWSLWPLRRWSAAEPRVPGNHRAISLAISPLVTHRPRETERERSSFLVLESDVVLTALGVLSS